FFEGAIYEINTADGSIAQTLVAPNSQATLVGPAGMTTGPDGNLYLSSQFTNSIVEYNVTTNTLSTFIDSSVLNSIAGQNGLAANFAPAGLRFGPDGNLYVALNGGQSATDGGGVIRFDMSGGAYAGTFAVVASGLVQPTELTFGTATND